MKNTANKKCESCKEVEIIYPSRKKKCEQCLSDIAKERNRITSQKKSMKKRMDLEQNFLLLDLKGLSLLPESFSKLSPIKYESYTNHYGFSWYKILEKFEVLDEFTLALKEEYKKFVECTGNQGFKLFGKHLKTSSGFLAYFNHDDFREYASIKYRRHNDSDLEENFREVVSKLGRPPLGKEEFNENSRIIYKTYTNRYGFNEDSMSRIVRMYTTDEEFESFLTLREAKLEISRRSGKTGVYDYTEEELRELTIEVVDEYLKNHKIIPSCEEFDRVSPFGHSAFKRRFNKTYLEMLIELNYDVNQYGSSTEKLVVSKIATILNEEPILQATFDWLRSDKEWNLKCDGYFPNHQLVVEYDGEQHTYPIEFYGGVVSFERTQQNDKLKNELIPLNNLTLIRINYDEPYHDESFLLMRLIENGIFPSGYTEVTHSSQKSA